MSAETPLHAAFWLLLGLMLAMRSWYAFRLLRAGERIHPDRAARQREGRRAVGIRMIGFLVLVALIAAAVSHRIPFQMFAMPLPPWVRWAGFVLGLAGLGLWTWTHVTLGRFWSANLELRRDHKLITFGPYSRMRHPMYTAMLGWVGGLWLVTANWVPFFFVIWLAAFVLGRVSREERMMVDRFGDDYRQYMKRTGRFLPLPVVGRPRFNMLSQLFWSLLLTFWIGTGCTTCRPPTTSAENKQAVSPWRRVRDGVVYVISVNAFQIARQNSEDQRS